MSKVDYTILAFDDLLNEFVISVQKEKICVPAVIVDGKIIEQDTKKAIETAIKSHLTVKGVIPPPSGAVEMIGTSGAVDLSTEVV